MRGAALVTVAVPGGGRLCANTMAWGDTGSVVASGRGSRGRAMRIASGCTIARTASRAVDIAEDRWRWTEASTIEVDLDGTLGLSTGAWDLVLDPLGRRTFALAQGARVRVERLRHGLKGAGGQTASGFGGDAGGDG